MDHIAIMMFTILGVALAFGIFQFVKMKKELPEDTSHLKPGRKLQQMDRNTEGKSVGGTSPVLKR